MNRKRYDNIWICEKVINMAKLVIEENGGHDIRFVTAKEVKDERADEKTVDRLGDGDREEVESRGEESEHGEPD